jgi:predicted NUDIX family phosphoesterase
MGKQALCFVKNEEYKLFNEGQQKELPARFVQREICETVEANYLQIIPYVVFYYVDFPEGKLNIFTYTRANSITEERLKGKMSVGVGGHIDSANDVVCANIEVTAVGEDNSLSSEVYHMTRTDLRDTVIRAAKREVQEELGDIAVLEKIEQYKECIIGFTLDTNEVDKVHTCYMVPVQLTLEEMQAMLANPNFNKEEIASIAVLPLNFKLVIEGLNVDQALNEMIEQIKQTFDIEAWGPASIYFISKFVLNLFTSISYEELAGLLADKVKQQQELSMAAEAAEKTAAAEAAKAIEEAMVDTKGAEDSIPAATE